MDGVMNASVLACTSLFRQILAVEENPRKRNELLKLPTPDDAPS